jgi:TrpR-related protein YerC/YecD
MGARAKQATTDETAALYDALLRLKTRAEAAAFMRDLCTIPEINALSERWSVARRVARGMSYRAVADETGASTTTVTRVAHWLHHGQGGYRTLLERLRK